MTNATTLPRRVSCRWRSRAPSPRAMTYSTIAMRVSDQGSLGMASPHELFAYLTHTAAFRHLQAFALRRLPQSHYVVSEPQPLAASMHPARRCLRGMSKHCWLVIASGEDRHVGWDRAGRAQSWEMTRPSRRPVPCARGAWRLKMQRITHALPPTKTMTYRQPGSLSL